MSKKSNRAKKETAHTHAHIEHVTPAVSLVNTATDVNESEKAFEMTAEQQTALDSIKTVSGQIRYLDSIGMSRGQIAKKLGKLYQHVRNVLTTPLKRKDVASSD